MSAKIEASPHRRSGVAESKSTQKPLYSICTKTLSRIDSHFQAGVGAMALATDPKWALIGAAAYSAMMGCIKVLDVLPKATADKAEPPSAIEKDNRQIIPDENEEKLRSDKIDSIFCSVLFASMMLLGRSQVGAMMGGFCTCAFFGPKFMKAMGEYQKRTKSQKNF